MIFASTIYCFFLKSDFCQFENVRQLLLIFIFSSFQLKVLQNHQPHFLLQVLNLKFSIPVRLKAFKIVNVSPSVGLLIVRKCEKIFPFVFVFF